MKQCLRKRHQRLQQLGFHTNQHEVVDPLVPPGVPGVDAAIQLETLKLDWREQSECGDFGFIM